MAKYKVVGLPNRGAEGNLKKTVSPIDRAKATIEAEFGETIWTNYNRNVDNIVELKAIGGKTHAKGGTPMDPPSAGKDGESSSFIFSNNRKMIIKDPELLKYFGENGKVEKTPAEVSKKWLDALATAKAILKDEHQDKIAKDSATLTMKNAAFNLSSLALWQESKKNFKDGMTDIFNPWFDKTQVTPDELFSLDPEHEEKATEALQSAFGGPMYKANGGSSDCPEGMIWSEEARTCVAIVEKPLNSNITVGGENQFSVNYNGVVSPRGIQTGQVGVGFQNDSTNANINYNVPDKSIMFNGNKEWNVGNGTLGVEGGYSAPINGMGKGSFNGGINYNTTIGSGSKAIPVKINLNYNQALGGPLNKAEFGGDPQHLDYEEQQPTDPQFLSLGGLKKYEDGGVLPPWKGSDDDLKKYFNGNKDIAAQYQYIESLKTNPAFKKALFSEYKQAWGEDIHGRGYKNLVANKKWNALNSEDEVVNNFIDMQKRNLSLRAHGIDYTQIKQNATDGKNASKYTNDFLKSRGLDKELAIPGMDKTAQEQASYIAFHKLTGKQGTYKDNKELEDVLSPFSAPKLGMADEDPFGNKDYPLSRADGVYTDTTTGQTAGFKGATPAANVVPIKPDIYKKGEVKHLEPLPPNINPDGFRIEDINTMNRAFAAKRRIINIPEWQKASQFNLLEPQFDSPERKIAEANSLAASGIRAASAFGSQASTQAAINNINAQVYAKAAGAIDDTSTKNIGLYNQVNQSNTQLANAKHAQDANEATNLWAQHAKRVQAFVNAHGKADDKITEAINNAYSERSKRYNLNVNSTYEKIDPLTGKIYLANAKPLDGRETSSDDIAQKYSDLKDKLPAGTDEKTVLAILKGQMSGDWKFKEDDILKPDEVKTKQG